MPVSKLRDVAQLAGVANATVSRALNGGKNVSKEAMARVAAAVSELDYKPNRAARSLKGMSSGIIGMIVPSISDLFFSRCAEAVEAVVREQGGVLVVAASHDDDALTLDSVRQLLLHNIDGLVIAYAKSPPRALIDALRRSGLPVVAIDGPLPGLGCPAVLCENFDGARLATHHLIAHGYRKVISVQVKPDLYTMRERLRGYRSAVEEADRKPVEETIHDQRSAVACIRRHVKHAQPVPAFFAGNNLTARFLCEAVHLLRLVIPRQLALLSFDDFDLADTLTPPMSVVRQPLEQIGRTAATLLYHQRQTETRQENNGHAAAVLLAPSLILRGSCGCETPDRSTAVSKDAIGV